MGKRQPKTSTKKQELNLPRTNREIPNYPSVRVVYVDNNGENTNRVLSMYDARRMADEMGLDLIEMSPNANPPVVKLYDFSKYVYELKKMKKAASHNHTEVKEIQLSTNISLHDLEIKANKAKEFIANGDKVRVVLTMKRRELERREESKRSILQFIVMMEDVATPESMPKDEGAKCVVILKKRN